MQRRVKCMVDRLSVPHVALRLRKEEVCLTISSLSRIGGSHDEPGPVSATMLRQRMLQFIPSCTPMELGMIASGSMALRWCDASLADQLATRAATIGASTGESKVKQQSLDTSGWLLLANASISWCDRSIATEHFAKVLVLDAIQRKDTVTIQDHDQLAASVLATVLFESSNKSVSSPLTLSESDHITLAELLAKNRQRMSDVGIGLAIAAVALSARLINSPASVHSSFASLAGHTVTMGAENPLSIAPLLLSLCVLPIIYGSTDHSTLKQAIVRQLEASATLMQASDVNFKTDEFLLSLVLVGKALAPEENVNLLAKFSLPNLSTSTLPSLSIGIISALKDASPTLDNQILASVEDQVKSIGRRSNQESSSNIHHLRESALTLLLTPAGRLTIDQLCLAITAARRSNLRDPSAQALLCDHLKHIVETSDVGGAKKVMVSMVADAASAVGIPEGLKSSLSALSDRSVAGSSGQADLNQITLPMQFKALKLRREVVSDNLLMSVLEAIEDWTAGDIAYFVAAAPDKCVEFDMLIDKLSSGLEELSSEQLAFVLEAVAECSALAMPLQDAAIAQTVEMLRVNKHPLEAPPLIAALIQLFVKTYAPQADQQVPQQLIQHREELRNLVEQSINNVLAALQSASVATTCAFLKAFMGCPTIGATAAEIASGHLLSFVQNDRCTPEELIDMLWAMAAVDVVHAELIDAIVPKLELILKSATPVFIAKFMDACVAIDTPELDTLFQLYLQSSTSDTTSLGTFEPADSVSVLNAALSLQHRAVVVRLISQLGISVGESKSTQFINALSSIIANGNIVPLLGPQKVGGQKVATGVKRDELSYLARQLMEAASSLIEGGHEPDVQLPSLFAASKCLLEVAATYATEEEAALPPAIPMAVVNNLMDRVDLMSGTEVATIICALPYFDLSSGDTSQMLQVILTRLSHEGEQCPTKLLSDAVFSLGELDGRIGTHITHHVAIEKLSDQCVDNVGMWTSGKSICRLLYGFSRVACNKRSLFNVFGTQLGKRPLLKLITRDDIALAMSAFGNAKYLDKELYDALAEHMVSIADDLNPADLTLVLAGYSRLNLLNTNLYQRLGERAAAISDQIPAGAAAKILCAYGHVGNEHENMASKLLAQVSENTAQLDANQCANSLYAVVQMNFNADSDHLDALAKRIETDVENLRGESIQKVCEVMQELNWRNDSLLRSMAGRSIQLSNGEDNGIKPEIARSVLDTLGLFMVHHSDARRQLSETARSVSRDPSIVAEIAAANPSAGEAAQIEG